MRLATLKLDVTSNATRMEQLRPTFANSPGKPGLIGPQGLLR